MGEMRNEYNKSVGKPEGNRHRRRRGDNIRMDRRKIVRNCGLDACDLG
jgi:hypothetical protein